MKSEIITEPAPILRKKLVPVAVVDTAVQELIAIMRATMVLAKGVGLAANQIGVDLQIFIIDKELAKESKVPDAYINPEISEISLEMDLMEEGCLSIPGYWHYIPRAK